jgi:glyoxylase-like metal-dependent hydrolase (beta-lactamase superfamily II)
MITRGGPTPDGAALKTRGEGTRMKTQHIGDISIDRVVDMEGPFSTLDFLIPNAPPDLIADNADWLKPCFVEPSTDKIIMSFHSLVVRTRHHTILVDCCIGNHKHRPERAMWHQRRGPWLDNLRAQGVEPEDIDIVTCTHLHADHVGWNTKLVDGRWVPTFPNACYVFARQEYAHWESEHRDALANGDRNAPNHGSFEDSVLPVVEAGRAVLVDSDYQIDDGVCMEPAPGHTPGNVIVHVGDKNARAILAGDVIHTPAQLAKPELSSNFCSDPVQSAATRQRLVDRCADSDTLMLTAHFPGPTAGRIVRHGEAFRFETGAA